MNHKNKLISIILIIASIIIPSGCSEIFKNKTTLEINNNELISKNCKFNKGIKINNTNTEQYNLGDQPNLNNKLNNKEEYNDNYNSQSVEHQLVNSAKSIEKSLATLAASQEMHNIPVLNTAPLITPEGGMGYTADIDWTGPIEPLLKKIAAMTNYNLKVLGSPSPIPIIVSITQNKAIIADILKNAALQAGKRANIVVFPANRIIELRYRFGTYNSQLSNNHHE